MAHTRLRAGRDAFPLLVVEGDNSADSAALTLGWRMVQSQACLMRSAAILKSGRTMLGEAHTRLTRMPAYLVLTKA